MPYKSPVSEPIAIVGSSCRFTGGATSPSRFWELLSQPSDLSQEVPPGRFNVRSFYHRDGDYHGTTNAPKGYWLDQDPRAFDAAFFGIAPKEAEAMDPQQRLLLETVYEALEGSGYLISDWAGKDVAVYVGAMTADFDTVSQRDDLSTSPYYATGNARSILSNRISYFYDFHGPSVTIDTACSSSLVALHQAVLSLRAGDCSAACVAGVNLMLAPEQFVVEASMHMLSPSGHCRMWDSGADGYARGEGLAVLLLKPLSRALAEGDEARIQALIRETGVASDGRTSGITVPSPNSQAALIRATYRRSGLDPHKAEDRCQYFEAHGTGTPVGDPREAKAIHSAFFCGPEEAIEREATEHHLPGLTMLVGSVKTVIGHTEGAAGLAGLLKVILSMRHGKVPANLHLTSLNPEVASFCGSPPHGNLRVPTELMLWPSLPPGQPSRASVNSFGFGGTNAHAILEFYEPSIHSPTDNEGEHSDAIPPKVVRGVLPLIPLLLSANSSGSLRILATKYRDFLKRSSHGGCPIELRRVAWRVYTSRPTLPFRLAISAETENEAADILSTLIDADVEKYEQTPNAIGLHTHRWNKPAERSAPRLMGIFTGQGAQWPGMSRHLFSESKIYRSSIRALDAHLAACPDPPAWSLENELKQLDPNKSKVYDAEFGQPLCTAVQIGLTDVLYKGLGLRFSCVVGHSSGEIAAAYAAGRLSARDAILIAYYRGKVLAPPHLSSAPRHRKGGMVAVGLSRKEADRFCQKEGYRGCLEMAASNCPAYSTLSGDVDAVDEAEKELKLNGVFARRILVDIAYHSHHMAAYSDAYDKALDMCSILPQGEAETTWVSSVDPGSRPPSTEELGRTYWVRNMVSPVLFHDALVQALSTFQGRLDAAVEVGPHPALKGPVNEIQTRLSIESSKSTAPYAGILHRGKQNDKSLSDFFGFLWMHLDPLVLDLRGLLGKAEKKILSDLLVSHQSPGAQRLPAYPWDHSKTFHSESRISRQFHFRSQPPHELLGSRTRDDIDGHELRWRNLLRLDKLPWLLHHSFQGQPLLPASAYCLMALEAATALLAGRQASVVELQDLYYMSGIVLDIEGPPQELIFSLTAEEPANGLSPSHDYPSDAISAIFGVFSAAKGDQGPLQQRCKGKIHIILGDPTPNELPPRLVGPQEPETLTVEIDSFYRMMAGLNLKYTGPFKALMSMRRRFNFAAATLKRRHTADTTKLFISPATLDACLQVCFSTYSSPGDGALWTSFLPIGMKKVSFNMAYCDGENKMKFGQTEGLVVHASLTDFCTPTRHKPARIVGDICIFNDSGQMEMQVEGLTVGSLATSQLQDRYEPYLRTVMAVDPEDTLVEATGMPEPPNSEAVYDRLLTESCFRVAAFYHSGLAGGMCPKMPYEEWPADTKQAVHNMILGSPYYVTLNGIVSLAARPLELSSIAPVLEAIVGKGRNLHRFQKHISGLTQQLVHRYPRMSLLSLTHPGFCLSSYILEGIGSSFLSFVIGTSGLEGNLPFHLARLRQSASTKVHQVPFDFKKTPSAQLKPRHIQDSPFNLVISSTSLLRQFPNINEALFELKSLMRPGGFLVLIDTTTQDDCGLGQPTYSTGICTPPEWPDILHNCGFTHPESHNADQRLPGGYSVFVRKCGSSFEGSALHPIAQLRGRPANLLVPDQHLLIIDIESTKKPVSSDICDVLGQNSSITVEIVNGLNGLAALPPSRIASFNCALILTDLNSNGAIFPFLTERHLCCFRELLQKPNMAMLWVTEGARSTNPNSAAAMGFARTIRAELPNLTLQMLNFDNFEISKVKSICSIVTHTFVQLMASVQWNREKDHLDPQAVDPLWTVEPEIYIDEFDRRLVPRILPYDAGNERLNASRQIVTKEINSLESSVQIVPSTRNPQIAEKNCPCYETRIDEVPGPIIGSTSCHTVLVRVY